MVAAFAGMGKLPPHFFASAGLGASLICGL